MRVRYNPNQLELRLVYAAPCTQIPDGFNSLHEFAIYMRSTAAVRLSINPAYHAHWLDQDLMLLEFDGGLPSIRLTHSIRPIFEAEKTTWGRAFWGDMFYEVSLITAAQSYSPKVAELTNRPPPYTSFELLRK